MLMLTLKKSRGVSYIFLALNFKSFYPQINSHWVPHWRLKNVLGLLSSERKIALCREGFSFQTHCNIKLHNNRRLILLYSAAIHQVKRSCLLVLRKSTAWSTALTAACLFLPPRNRKLHTVWCASHTQTHNDSQEASQWICMLECRLSWVLQRKVLWLKGEHNHGQILSL